MKRHFLKYAHDPEGAEFVEWSPVRRMDAAGATDDIATRYAGAAVVVVGIRARNQLGGKMLQEHLYIVRDGEVLNYTTEVDVVGCWTVGRLGFVQFKRLPPWPAGG